MTKKILVCNAQHEFLKSAVTRLRSWGYSVIVAEDADQSVHLAHLEKPDLILLDHMIPAGGAEAVHKYLNLSVDTELIPIILFAELPSQELSVLAEELEAEDYLSKSYDPNILHAKIQKIFGDAEQYKI